MGEDLLSLVFKDKKIKGRAIRAAAKLFANATPIVKTIEAGHGIIKIGETLSKANELAGRVNDFAPRANQMADGLNKFIPAMQVMGQSVCDSARIFAYFSMIATTVRIGVNIVQTYQGIQALQLIAAKLQDISVSLAAQTALMAQKEFPDYVHSMIRERLTQTSDDASLEHWFFLWHPDDDWYPKFFHLLEEKPLGSRFCGYTNQIDSVFVFMIAARRRITEMEYKARRRGHSVRPTRLHLLIPAYQPILIAEALKIPEEVGDFVMEGRINSNREFVWLNLPDDQRHYVLNIGQWIPPNPGWLVWAASKIGLGEKPPKLRSPRALGSSQRPLEIEAAPSPADDEDDGSSTLVNPSVAPSEASFQEDDDRDKDKDKSRRQSMPLHQRERRHRSSRRN
ncbi:hypothetical protein Trco_003339 [Trichoderma cornu-damae]|uniref:Uncharacterized protein n=1 Tax=Trichoderma cornu-damae TaxID=654480 RepID=A0A9P8TT70_9HYPO|nr:hypothetical protein Trco_003339 [Trichoderma cornu-damae]